MHQAASFSKEDIYTISLRREVRNADEDDFAAAKLVSLDLLSI
jgi:hypothetical protein